MKSLVYLLICFTLAICAPFIIIFAPENGTPEQNMTIVLLFFLCILGSSFAWVLHIDEANKGN